MNRIGLVLMERGQKQKWLAERLGMTTVTVNLYVQNKKQPRLDTLMRISSILNVDIHKLIDENIHQNAIVPNKDITG